MDVPEDPTWGCEKTTSSYTSVCFSSSEPWARADETILRGRAKDDQYSQHYQVRDWVWRVETVLLVVVQGAGGLARTTAAGVYLMSVFNREAMQTQA